MGHFCTFSDLREWAQDIFQDVNDVFHRRASRCFRAYKLDLRQELYGIIQSQVEMVLRNRGLASKEDLQRMVQREIDTKMV